MKLLAIETATEACSVALWIDGKILERFEIAPRRHSGLVLPWADALLAEAGIARGELDAIACGRGPGAFTGVRLAVALTQGIALALDRPAVPVSTLHALALQAPTGADEVVAAIDARMNEVYVARYRREREALVLLDEEAVIDPALYRDSGVAVVGVGSGFDACGGALRRGFEGRLVACDADALPRAGAVARIAAAAFALGAAVDPSFLEPAYLRNRVALTIRERQAVRQAGSTTPFLDP